MSNIYKYNNNIRREYPSNDLKDNKKESININPENEKELNKRCILSLLSNNEKGVSSVKTVDTNLNKFLYINYNYEEIKRFDEINNSLSDISDFDLEMGDNEDDSEFNSSEEDKNSSQDEIICVHSKIRSNSRIIDSEYEKEINRECEEIIRTLTFEKKL